MTHPDKVLITGASGLVGEGVLRRLLTEDPGLEAFVLVHNDLRWQLVSRRLGSLAPRVIPVRGDVTLPGLGLEPLVKKRVERETVAHPPGASVTSSTPLPTSASPGHSITLDSSTRWAHTT